MQLFNSGIFWFIEGIILCIVIMAFSVWMKEKNIPMPLWKWFAFVIWIFFFGFTIAFIGTSLGENEANAAVKGGILFGIISIISGAGLWRMIKTGAGKAE